MKPTRGGSSLITATEYTPVASSSSFNDSSMNNRRNSSSYKSPYGKLTAYIPIRYIVLFMVLVATAVEYICRYNINVSMVAMVKPVNHTGMEYNVCPLPRKSNNSDDQAHVPSGSYDWDSRTQGIILGAFFYTYTLMQIPSGRIAEEFGGRWVVSISLLGSGILNLLTPHLTSSVFTMTISRLILGVLQGGLFPACFAIIFNWFPLKERSIGYAVMEVGTMVGSISASALAGYLAEHGFAGGWPSTFYISGIIAVLSAAIWTPYVTSSPEEHFCVTVGELKTIRHEPTRDTSDEEAPGTSHDCSSKVRRNRKKLPVPWLAILTNKAVLANVFAKFFLRWTFYTLIMKLPTYLNDMLHMSPTKNGFINATMYLITVGPMLGAGYVSERLIQASIIDRTNCRKLFVSMACIGSALCIGLVPLAGCNEAAVICLLLIGNTFGALDSAGNIPNPGELSKHYATTVFAIVNMLNTSAGFIVPYLVGLILTAYKYDPMFAWSVVFYLASGISLLGALIYILFGSAERQPFDFDPKLDHLNDDVNVENSDDVEELLESEDEPIVNLQEQLLEQHSPVRRLTGFS